MGFKDSIRKKSLKFHDTTDIQKELLQRQKESNPFPLHVFHPRVHPVMNRLIQDYRLTPSYVGASFLAAYSSAIGTAYTVSQNEHADPMFLAIYLGLVGDSSQGKSTAINKAFAPIKTISDQYSQDYDEQTKGMSDEHQRESKFREWIIRDVRVPTLLKDSLPANPKGVVKLQGEIIEWIKGMNPGGKREGTDEEFWISTWNCDPYQKTLSGNRRYYIPSPFVNIIGGVQWDVVPEIFDGKRSTSGFAYRILFAVPENENVAWRIKGAYTPANEMAAHEKCIQRLHEDLAVTDVYHEPYRCILTPDAEQLHYDYFDELRQQIDDMDPQLARKAKGIFGKMVEYSLRFAAILHLHHKSLDPGYGTDFGTGFAQREPIVSKTMQYALDLTSYFYRAAQEVNERVEKLIIAPPEVLLMAGMLKNGKTYRQMLDVYYQDDNKFQAEKELNPKNCYEKYRKRLKRTIESYQRDYPKAFGIWR